MGTPKVSVIVPVHNGRSTLERTIRSVLDQSLPPDQVEIIAVDDGSTDGSGEELDRLAAGRRGFTVVHQEASGGPGRPRNVGIERATGEYVFFLDADDHLAPEALERCCAMADANETDVVVPKYVGVGRKVNPYLFRETVESTTIYDAVPNLYGSITALKLYRRGLLDRHHIRFPEGMLSGEDQIFAVRAYFEAKGVSVLADYDCYYWVERNDGTSALQRGGAPAETYFPEIKRLMAFVAERTGPGPVRDRLLRRHFAIEVFSRFDPRYQAFSEDERRATRDAARELAGAWSNPEIMAALSPYSRVLDHALRHGLDDLVDEAARRHAVDPPPIVVDGDRAYLAYPGFRDPELAIPDDVFEVHGPLGWRRRLTGLEWRDGRLLVRGYAFVDGVGDGEQSEELVLRRRPDGAEYRIPFRRATPSTEGPAEGRKNPELVAEIDFGAAGPAPGRWDAWVVVTIQRLTHEGRLVAAQGVRSPGGRIAMVRTGRPLVTPYLTSGIGALALHVGGRGGQPAPAEPAEPARRPSGTLRLETVLATALPDDGTAVSVRALLRHRETGETRAAEATVERRPESLDVSAELDLQGARRGIWDASYEVTAGSATGEFRAPAGADLPSAGRRSGPFRTVRGNLSVRVGTARIGTARIGAARTGSARTGTTRIGSVRIGNAAVSRIRRLVRKRA
ncbi:glycosyltransferase family 2 protein [Actinomadura sp. 9N407]|uniref:glycosyltransferase family 2 protein n=1 Tax=Actinomadura sp. 9N407 TaxID=3375154 RepID=UPI0037A68773